MKKLSLGQSRLARYWSNRELAKIAPLFRGDVVNVSAGENKDKQGGTYDQYFSHARSFHITNYGPGSFRGYEGRENEHLLDLEADLPLELEGRFDVVMNHTVLEHVFDVHKAFSNLCAMSRDVVIIVVPFTQLQHDADDFGDFWRFCPSGMRRLFKANGFDVVYESMNTDVDAAVYLLFVGSRHPERWLKKMPPYVPLSNAGAWIGRSQGCKSCFKRFFGYFRRKSLIVFPHS